MRHSALIPFLAVYAAANPDDQILARRVVPTCSKDPKTPQQWQAGFNTAAEQAPPGYERVFANLHASNKGLYGYLGYSVLSGNYSAAECARQCSGVNGCQSFNLYYERAPSVEPTEACPNPVSQTLLKCVFYGGPVSQATATNDGQYVRDFHVLIAGSNGYVNRTVSTPEGYQPAVSLGNFAMSVPVKDCAGHPTYLGLKTFHKGPFSVDKCAAACTATSNFNRAHLTNLVNGQPRTCQSFVTYILYNGTTAIGQSCALYDQTWPVSFATDKGHHGQGSYNIDYSYMFSNTTGAADQPQGCDNPSAPGQPGVCHIPGQVWSTRLKSCVPYKICNSDTQYLNKTTNSCVTCQGNVYLDKNLQRCVPYPKCNTRTQYLDKTKKTCVAYPHCNAATQYLDRAKKACVAYPICKANQVLNKRKKICEPRR